MSDSRIAYPLSGWGRLPYRVSGSVHLRIGFRLPSGFPVGFGLLCPADNYYYSTLTVFCNNKRGVFLFCVVFFTDVGGNRNPCGWSGGHVIKEVIFF